MNVNCECDSYHSRCVVAYLLRFSTLSCYTSKFRLHIIIFSSYYIKSSFTMAGVDLVQVVENYVKSNKVMIFSKSRCPYCTRVKELFKSLGVDFFALELDTLENGAEMQKAMAQKAGRSSVPQVFINEQHIGGCDDTMAAHNSGKLQTLL